MIKFKSSMDFLVCLNNLTCYFFCFFVFFPLFLSASRHVLKLCPTFLHFPHLLYDHSSSISCMDFQAHQCLIPPSLQLYYFHCNINQKCKSETKKHKIQKTQSPKIQNLKYKLLRVTIFVMSGFLLSVEWVAQWLICL